ncbi:MAG: PDZ domain-containing protein [Pseudomonadota bacterium]
MSAQRPAAVALTLAAILSWPSILPAQSGGGDPRNERINQAIRTMLISLAQDPLFDGEDLDVVFSQQPEALINLGVIYGDTRSSDIDSLGLPVVAVTPGSTAAAMGLRAGDRIVSMNTEPLLGLGQDDKGVSRAVDRVSNMLQQIPANDPVTLIVARGNRRETLTAPLQKWQLPRVELALSMPEDDGPPEDLILGAPPGSDDDRSPCGTLSLYDPPPHEFNLYPAYLMGINVNNSGGIMRGFQYLPPGEYELLVSDLIPSRELRIKHTRFAKRRQARQMTLEVADGMVYHVAAKLLHERKQQAEHDEYWEPVVWRSEPGHCKGKPVAR